MIAAWVKFRRLYITKEFQLPYLVASLVCFPTQKESNVNIIDIHIDSATGCLQPGLACGGQAKGLCNFA